MKGFILLSGEDIDLALGELEGVLRSFGSSISIESVDGRSVILTGPVPDGAADSMGLCHFSGDLKDACESMGGSIHDMVVRVLQGLDMKRTISVKVSSPEGEGELSRNALFTDFCLSASERGFRLHHREPDLGMFLIIGENAYMGIIKERSNRSTMAERRGSRMPFNRPIVMEPKLARAMVNLTGLCKGSVVMDPFLGPAGLAMEAGHLGFNVIGVERDPMIYKGALMNIEAQGLSADISAFNTDSRKLDETDWWKKVKRIDGIVTDPPFGRSAPLMGEDPSELLMKVISVISPKMEKGAPLVMDTDQNDNLEKLKDFNVKRVYPFRVHRSLTRFIGVLEKT